MNACICAVQHLRPLRGGAQSHLLKASDGACYVTKFQQHIRVLANEMLATNLGLALGLPMPRVEVIEVPDWFIEQNKDLRINLGGSKIPCRSGKQLGSRHGGPENLGQTLDYLPRYLLGTAANVHDFARVLVLDKWTCNSTGGRQYFVARHGKVKALPQHSSIIFLEDISEELPPYEETYLSVPMDAPMQEAYRELEDDMRKALKAHRGNQVGA